MPCNDLAGNGIEFGCWNGCTGHGGVKDCLTEGILSMIRLYCYARSASVIGSLCKMLCFTSAAGDDDCGDHPERIATASHTDLVLLGNVELQTIETYHSCRQLCREAHPDFQFYHKFINYQSCECLQLVPGKLLSTKSHGAYTFGYAKACGKLRFCYFLFR